MACTYPPDPVVSSREVEGGGAQLTRSVRVLAERIGGVFGARVGGLRGQDTALIDTHSSSSSLLVRVLPRPTLWSESMMLSGNLESN